MFYPLKFFPVYKNMIWGGRNIEEKFTREIPEGTIGESWEICCREDGMSIVSNGRFKNRELEGLINEYKESLLGSLVYGKLCYSVFPLLIKVIDANGKLSVQVHPHDEYAAQYNDNGKTELWYVLNAKPGAEIIYGFKNGVNKNSLIRSIHENNIEELLNKIPVKTGDVIYIPSGTVHAMLKDVLIAEIQQNSNTTYRLYDWNRTDENGNFRELHLEKALDVIRFGECVHSNDILNNITYSTYSMKILSKNEYFSIEELSIHGGYSSSTDGLRFYIYMIIGGSGIIEYQNGKEELILGDTILIPAAMGKYNISGNIKVLRIYV